MTFGKDKIAKPANMKLEAQLKAVAEMQVATEKKIAVARSRFENYANLSSIEQHDFSLVERRLPLQGCMSKVDGKIKAGVSKVNSKWKQNKLMMHDSLALYTERRQCLEKSYEDLQAELLKKGF